MANGPDTLEQTWRAATAAAYTAKAEAIEDALVALDAVVPLIPDRRMAEVRAVEATLRDEIRECQQAVEEGRP